MGRQWLACIRVGRREKRRQVAGGCCRVPPGRAGSPGMKSGACATAKQAATGQGCGQGFAHGGPVCAPVISYNTFVYPQTRARRDGAGGERWSDNSPCTCCMAIAVRLKLASCRYGSNWTPAATLRPEWGCPLTAGGSTRGGPHIGCTVGLLSLKPCRGSSKHPWELLLWELTRCWKGKSPPRCTRGGGAPSMQLMHTTRAVLAGNWPRPHCASQESQQAAT